jgi:IS30 family transposase
MSDEEIQDIVMTANLTPRKCLGFLTPFQAIIKELSIARGDVRPS